MDKLLPESTPSEEAAALLRERREEAMRFAETRLGEAEKTGNTDRIKRAREVCRIVGYYESVNNFGALTTKIGGWIMLAGASVFGYQCYLWLRDGEWTPMPVFRSLHEIGLVTDAGLAGLVNAIEGTEWRGLQKIVAWVIGEVITLPASAALFFVGLGIVLLGLHYADRRPR
jgi:hypothetical protein